MFNLQIRPLIIYIYDIFDRNDSWKQVTNTILDKYFSHLCELDKNTMNKMFLTLYLSLQSLKYS